MTTCKKLTTARKNELRRGLAAMIDLAWRCGELSVPRYVGGREIWEPGTDTLSCALTTEELAYVERSLNQIIGRLMPLTLDGVAHTTRTVLNDLLRWTQSPVAICHLTDSVEVFEAACALRNAIQKYLDTLESVDDD